MARFEDIAVYIMASKRNGTLYLGVTTNLPQRALQHREGKIEGFSQRYGCKLLVWFEQHQEFTAAIAREKDIKKWRCAWKLALIEKTNPQWRDLYADFSNPRLALSPRASCPPLVIPGHRAAMNPEPRGDVRYSQEADVSHQSACSIHRRRSNHR
jgi:putative endonuclease